MKLVMATQNPGKLKEMKTLLSGMDITVVSAREAGVSEEVKEDGHTFEANALKKAVYTAKKTGCWAVADDSGLCIKALDGQPGVYSARWAGKNSTSRQKLQHALKATKHVPAGKRQAYFGSALALVSPRGGKKIFTARLYGRLTTAPRGKMRSRLPYDSIFVPTGFKKTFSEMSDRQKNKLSHRGKTFNQLKKYLKNIL